MADNTVLNAGAGGDTIATDDVGGVKHQLVKIEFGADLSATRVTAAAPLPVTQADGGDVTEGVTTDAAVTGDNTGTISAKIRGLNKILANVWDSVNGWLKVLSQSEGTDGTAVPSRTTYIGVRSSDNGAAATDFVSLRARSGNPIGSEQGLVVRNIPSGFQSINPATDIDISASGSITANSQEVASLNTRGLQAALITITGTWVGTIAFQVVDDAGNRINVPAITVATGAVVYNTTANGSFYVAGHGAVTINVKSTAWASGTATVQSRANVVDGTNVVGLNFPLPTGSNVIGQVTANAGTNLNTSALALDATVSAVQTRKIQDSSGGSITVGQKAMAASVPVVLASDQTSIPFPNASTRSDTYVGLTSGTTVTALQGPTAFGIQVKGTGASATTWDVRLEGSLDNVNFSTILQHTNTTGDGAVLWSGTVLSPSLYFRSRVAGLVLSAATNVVVTIVGK